MRDVAARLNAEPRIHFLRDRVGELRVDPQPLGLCAESLHSENWNLVLLLARQLFLMRADLRNARGGSTAWRDRTSPRRLTSIAATSGE